MLTAPQLVRAAMVALDCDGPAELARELGLTAYGSPRRVKRWIDGTSEPDYEATVAILIRLGMLRDAPGETVEVGRPIEPEVRSQDDRLRSLEETVKESNALTRRALELLELLGAPPVAAAPPTRKRANG